MGDFNCSPLKSKFKNYDENKTIKVYNFKKLRELKIKPIYEEKGTTTADSNAFDNIFLNENLRKFLTKSKIKIFKTCVMTLIRSF